MWFAPFGDAFSLLLVVRRFHDLRSFHQRLLKVGPLRGPEVIRQAYGAYLRKLNYLITNPPAALTVHLPDCQ